VTAYQPPPPRIENHHLTTDQLRRAWCLMLVVSLWPTITPQAALGIATWLWAGRTDDKAAAS